MDWIVPPVQFCGRQYTQLLWASSTLLAAFLSGHSVVLSFLIPWDLHCNFGFTFTVSCSVPSGLTYYKDSSSNAHCLASVVLCHSCPRTSLCDPFVPTSFMSEMPVPQEWHDQAPLVQLVLQLPWITTDSVCWPWGSWFLGHLNSVSFKFSVNEQNIARLFARKIMKTLTQSPCSYPTPNPRQTGPQVSALISAP